MAKLKQWITVQEAADELTHRVSDRGLSYVASQVLDHVLQGELRLYIWAKRSIGLRRQEALPPDASYRNIPADPKPVLDPEPPTRAEALKLAAMRIGHLGIGNLADSFYKIGRTISIADLRRQELDQKNIEKINKLSEREMARYASFNALLSTESEEMRKLESDLRVGLSPAMVGHLDEMADYNKRLDDEATKIIRYEGHGSKAPTPWAGMVHGVFLVRLEGAGRSQIEAAQDRLQGLELCETEDMTSAPYCVESEDGRYFTLLDGFELGSTPKGSEYVLNAAELSDFIGSKSDEGPESPEVFEIEGEVQIKRYSLVRALVDEYEQSDDWGGEPYKAAKLAAWAVLLRDENSQPLWFRRGNELVSKLNDDSIKIGSINKHLRDRRKIGATDNSD